MEISKWQNTERYAAQSDIVKQALATPEHSLDQLLDLMRGTRQAAVYFSGSRLDNDYCFGSKDVGILLSVMPEDAQKAAEPGYHPVSTEVYVTFQGSLMECLENGQVKDTLVGQNYVLILPPGQCHRVRYDGERKAASAIVKTNLGHKPGVVRCDTCEYFPDPNECPLHQRWNMEKKS
jgi:hypothetical protein